MVHHRFAWFHVLWIWLATCGATVVGQDNLVDKKSPTDAAAANDESFRELTIYVPYEKLKETFEVEGRGVFLPYEKFQALWKAAREKLPTPKEVNPPVKAVITEIENEASVKNDVIRVSAKLTIELLDDGWVEIPLRLRDVAVLSAKIEGKPALLVSGKNGSQSLLIKADDVKSKNVVLNLEYAKSISKSPGQNSVAFEAPLAPVNQWRIRIPESGVKVNVSPMLAATEELKKFRTKSVSVQEEGEDDNTEPSTGGDPESSETEPSNAEATPESITDDETVILAFVGAAKNLKINWTPKAEGASGLDALVNLQTISKIVIEEGLTVTQTTLQYNISRSELSELKLEVPDDQKITSVTDPNVRNWNVEDSGGKQVISIGLFQPVRNQQNVLLELEKLRSEAETEVSVPAIKGLGVDRQRGLVLVRVADGFRVEPSQRSGFVQVDQSDIPAQLKTHPWVYAYRYASLPYEMKLDVQPVKSKIHVDQLVEAYLEPQALSVDLFAKIKVERAPVFELEFELPADFEIMRVQGRACSGAVAANVESHFVEQVENGGRVLRVNLATKALGTVGLVVELEKRLSDPNLVSATGETTQLEIIPPRVTSEFAQSVTGNLVLNAPDSLRAVVAELSGLRNVTFQEAFQHVPSNRNGRFPATRNVQAFTFAKPLATATLNIERRQPQIGVSQLVVTRIEPGLVKYEATLFYDIRYSSVKQLRLDVPVEIAPLIRNESTALRESPMTDAPEDLAEGYVAWLLTGETELLGQIPCKLTWERPIAELGIGKSVDIVVPRLIPQGASRSDGQIVLIKAETIDVVPTEPTRGLDPIDPQHDLMRNIKIADAAAALEYHDAWQLNVKATRYQLEVLKQTSIEQAVVRSVVTRSDRISVQALYRMRSNQQRLKVRLPDQVTAGGIEFDTDPLRINGTRTTLERGEDAQSFLIPLVGIDTNQPFLLELRYTIPGGASKITYPDFPDEPAIQKVSMVAYLPDDQKYLGRQGPWTDEFHWARKPNAQWAPQPKIRITKLIQQLTRGIAMSGDPNSDFSTDGQALLFSTLRPEPADQGALRLTTVNRQLLHGLTFGVVAIAGVVLIRRSIWDKIAVVCGLAAIVVLIGVFLPAFANALAGRTAYLAIGAVALLWGFAFFASAGAKLQEIKFQWPETKKKDVEIPPIQEDQIVEQNAQSSTDAEDQSSTDESNQGGNNNA